MGTCSSQIEYPEYTVPRTPTYGLFNSWTYRSTDEHDFFRKNSHLYGAVNTYRYTGSYSNFYGTTNMYGNRNASHQYNKNPIYMKTPGAFSSQKIYNQRNQASHHNRNPKTNVNTVNQGGQNSQNIQISSSVSNQNTPNQQNQTAQQVQNSNQKITVDPYFTQKWTKRIVVLDKQSSEYYLVKRICLLPFEIVEIKKVQNDWIYLKYVGQRFFLTHRDNKPVEEIKVFHGSNIDPYEICMDETGFDFRNQENQRNSWGRASHFSDNVMYAHSRAFRKDGLCSIIMAKALIGKFTESAIQDSDAKLPPDLIKSSSNSNDNVKEKYDLVTGIENNVQRVYAYYENYNALPLYIITYDENKPINLNYPKRWLWVDNSRHFFNLISSDINNLIERNRQEGKLETRITLKLRPGDINTESYTVFITPESETLDGYLEHIEKKEKIPLFSKFTNIDIEEQLHSVFCSSLEYDLKCIIHNLSTYNFDDAQVTNNIMRILAELPNIDLNDLEVKLIDLDKTEYRKIENRFLETMNLAKVQSIKKVKNNLQKYKFLIEKLYITIKSKTVNEQQLFHGTTNTAPELLCKDMVGFDMRYSNNGYWGKANYFAVNASYSNCYAYEKSDYRQMFFADVIIGKCTRKYAEHEKHREWAQPPYLDENKKEDRYDSVYANTSMYRVIISDVYMLYENYRAYPTYLITYK